MKILLLLVFLAACNSLSAQRLVWLQETPGGSVVANIHPKADIDPVNPAFNSNYEHTRNYDCSDSLFSQLKFHSPRYGDAVEATAEQKCFSQTDFSYVFLFDNQEWVNTSDLLSLIRVESPYVQWQELGGGKWELNSSRHMYICSNDRTGHDVTDHQLWQLDAERRVKTIVRLSAAGRAEDRYDFTYTSFGKIQRIIGTAYNSADSTQYAQHCQEWLYDDKQRDAVMISYDRPAGPFTKTDITRMGRLLTSQFKNGQARLTKLLDSNQIRGLVVYNYGRFGVEQVACYYNPAELSLDTHFYSDSIFYNRAGKITRYAAGKTNNGNACVLNYSYDKTSGRLARVAAREYADCVQQGCNESRIQQSFAYKNGVVNTLTENIFEINYQYKEEKYINPVESLEEERVYTYRYKRGGQ